MNRDLLLWLAILAGPVMWFLDLEADFALAPWLCGWHSRFSVGLVSAAAVAVVAGFGLAAWHEWRHLRSGPADTQAAEARPRVLAIGALVLSTLFVIVIAAQAIPNMVLDGCQ